MQICGNRPLAVIEVAFSEWRLRARPDVIKVNTGS